MTANMRDGGVVVRQGDIRIVAELSGDRRVVRYRVDVCDANCRWRSIEAAYTLKDARLIALRSRQPASELILGYFLETGEHDATGRKGEIAAELTGEDLPDQ